MSAINMQHLTDPFLGRGLLSTAVCDEKVEDEAVVIRRRQNSKSRCPDPRLEVTLGG